MRVFRPFLGVAAAALVVLTAGTSQAALVTFDNILASWINVDPAGVVSTGNGTANPSLRWGTPVPNAVQSGYDFESSITPLNIVLPPSPSSNFDLGTFTHINQPIYAPFLSMATLQLDASISVDGSSIGVKTFLFDFTHYETPNGSNPCANGEANGGSGVNSNGCADIISIGFNNLSESFAVGSDLFTLNILGFNDGSGLVNAFETKERAINMANLIGSLTLISTIPVPEPSSMAVFGLGLLALGFMVRRRRIPAA